MKAKKIIAAAMAVGMILSVSVNTMASWKYYRFYRYQ